MSYITQRMFPIVIPHILSYINPHIPITIDSSITILLENRVKLIIVKIPHKLSIDPLNGCLLIP